MSYGANIIDLNKAFDTLYQQIQHAKSAITPIKKSQIINNVKTTSKFKRMSKVLNKYSQQLRNNGKTPHLSKVIRDTQNLLILEGNQCKMNWWKIEHAAKDNKKNWRRISKVSGGGKNLNSTSQH